MNHHLEDRFGKALLIIIFSYFAAGSMKYLAAIWLNYSQVPYGSLVFISQLCSLIFLALIVYFTLTRLPARNAQTGVMPRLIAVAGTFGMMLVPLTQHVEIGPTLRIVSTGMIVVGTILSILCLARLGRSFSVAPTARALVVTGPYRLVRHPLYAAEALTVVGVAISNGSLGAYSVAIACLLFQVARARLEEQVLTATFPEYRDYAARVPMLVPGLKMRLPAAQKAQPGLGEPV